MVDAAGDIPAEIFHQQRLRVFPEPPGGRLTATAFAAKKSTGRNGTRRSAHRLGWGASGKPRRLARLSGKCPIFGPQAQNPLQTWSILLRKISERQIFSSGFAAFILAEKRGFPPYSGAGVCSRSRQS
ncbi:hypothetical protein, partial [uncultured Desulfovibrio sp.]